MTKVSPIRLVSINIVASILHKLQKKDRKQQVADLLLGSFLLFARKTRLDFRRISIISLTGGAKVSHNANMRMHFIRRRCLGPPLRRATLCDYSSTLSDDGASSPKSACSARTASSRYFSSMTTVILISDVLII